MPLVTSEKMLTDAREGGYAVGAFNVENMEMVKAVIAAAEEVKAPVMLQTTPSTVKYGTLETYFAMGTMPRPFQLPRNTLKALASSMEAP